MLEKTIPHNMAKLFHRLGDNAAKTGQLMGISPSTVNRAMASNETTQRQEDRALEVLQRLDQEALLTQEKREAVFLVRVSSDKTDLFTNLAAAAGFDAVAVQ